MNGKVFCGVLAAVAVGTVLVGSRMTNPPYSATGGAVGTGYPQDASSSKVVETKVHGKNIGGTGADTPPRWQSDSASSPVHAPEPLSQPSNIMIVVKTSTASESYPRREGRVAGILK